MMIDINARHPAPKYQPIAAKYFGYRGSTGFLADDDIISRMLRIFEFPAELLPMRR